MQEEIERLLSELRQYLATHVDEELGRDGGPEEMAAPSSDVTDHGAGRPSWWRNQFHG